MGEIYEWVRNIVIYLILNTIIMNLLGNSSYKKYVSIVSGMILLLIVVTPFLKLFNIDEILDYYLNANIYQADVSDFQNELRIMEDSQKDKVYAELNKMISAQVADILLENDLYLYKVDIVINQDVTSNSFGEIESLNITAGYVEDKGIPVQKINIERIAISGKIEDSEDDINIMQSLPSPAEIQIKNRLSDFYNMKQDNINISIQGG